MNLPSMERMKAIYELKEREKARRPKIWYHINSILHIWTVLSVLCWWLETLKLWAGCLLNSKVGMCPVLGWYAQTKVCIAGGSREWKGLKCNAFEMKWIGAKEWNMTCSLLSPEVWGAPGWDFILSCAYILRAYMMTHTRTHTYRYICMWKEM